VVTHRGEVHEVREYRIRCIGASSRAPSQKSRRIAIPQSGTGHWRRASRGSIDIKITGHAAQEATRSCIVGQVQWLHLATHTAHNVRCVMREGTRWSVSPPSILLRFLLLCVRRWTCRSATYALEAAVCLFWSASRKIDRSSKTPTYGIINDRECICIIIVRKEALSLHDRNV